MEEAWGLCPRPELTSARLLWPGGQRWTECPIPKYSESFEGGLGVGAGNYPKDCVCSPHYKAVSGCSHDAERLIRPEWTDLPSRESPFPGKPRSLLAGTVVISHFYNFPGTLVGKWGGVSHQHVCSCTKENCMSMNTHARTPTACTGNCGVDPGSAAESQRQTRELKGGIQM